MDVVADWRAERPWLGETIVCDGLLPWSKKFLPPGARLCTQLKRFRENGFDHISLTAAGSNEGPVEALARLGHMKSEIKAEDAGIRVVDDLDAIRQAKADGVLSVSFHFQTATPFAPDLDLVDAFYGVGVGRALLAYNQANIFADGCHEPRDAGLSAAGHQLVQRMDQIGMVVDLSHCGARTSFDVIEADLSRPPIFSHSNARALYDHERNITDAQIRLCAERGGYIGINGVGFFLGAGQADIPERMAEHAAHIAGIAGANRVGLGLDFMFLEGSDYAFFMANRDKFPRGYPDPPWSFIQPEQFGDLVAAFEGKGFSQAEIKGILGDNYLRLAN